MKKLSEGRERLRQQAGLDDFKLPGIKDNTGPSQSVGDHLFGVRGVVSVRGIARPALYSSKFGRDSSEFAIPG